VWKRRRAALYDHGYTVLPVVDAMTDLDADEHRHGVENVFPLISETATIDVLALLVMRKCVPEREATSTASSKVLSREGSMSRGATAFHLHGNAGADEHIAPCHAAIR